MSIFNIHIVVTQESKNESNINTLYLPDERWCSQWLSHRIRHQEGFENPNDSFRILSYRSPLSRLIWDNEYQLRENGERNFRTLHSGFRVSFDYYWEPSLHFHFLSRIVYWNNEGVSGASRLLKILLDCARYQVAAAMKHIS